MALTEDKACQSDKLAKPLVGFLDLPAELRNHVYQHALVFESRQYYGSRTCSVALLATCKQVQKEAQDILHAENEVIIRLATSANPKQIITLTANGRNIAFKKEDGAVLEIQWPCYLRKIRRIRIGISMNHRESRVWTTTMYTLNHILYNINYMVLRNPYVGRVRVDVTNTAAAAGIVAREDMLAPLSLLGQRAELDFQGLPKPMIQRILLDSIDVDSNDSMDVFELYSKLRIKARECCSLCAGMSPLPKSVVFVKESLLRAESHLPAPNTMMNVSRDSQLKQDLYDLDLGLTQIDWQSIESKLRMPNTPAKWYRRSLSKLRNRQRLIHGISKIDTTECRTLISEPPGSIHCF